MDLTFLLFAVARERAGVEKVRMSLEAGARVGDAVRELTRLHPVLDDMVAGCRVARNGEFTNRDQPLAAEDELALIPPVSGG